MIWSGFPEHDDGNGVLVNGIADPDELLLLFQ
jgi:hypothetical protein